MNFETGRDAGDRRPEPGVSSANGGGLDWDPSVPVTSFLDVVKSIFRTPAEFFRGMVKQGNYLRPLFFALICTGFLVLISGLVGTLGNIFAGDLGVLGALGGYLLLILFAPVVVAVVLFVSAGIYHLVVLLVVKPSGSSYETTFRVLAYSTVAALPAAIAAPAVWIPIVGPIVSLLVSLVIGIYLIYLTVIGIREAHATTIGRALLVILIPSVASFLLNVLFFALAGAALFFA